MRSPSLTGLPIAAPSLVNRHFPNLSTFEEPAFFPYQKGTSKMQAKEILVYEMFGRVRDVGAEHTDLFPAGSALRAQFDALNALISEIDTHAGEQAAGTRVAKQSSTTKAAAREKLRADLAAINRTVRTMELDTPGIADQFRMPKRTDAALVAAARAFLINAAPLKAAFIKYEMPADFLEELQADLIAFEECTNRQNVSRERHVGATASIQELLARGLKIVKQLDTLIQNKFEENRSLIAVWRSASRTEQPATRTRAKKQPAAPAQ